VLQRHRTGNNDRTLGMRVETNMLEFAGTLSSVQWLVSMEAPQSRRLTESAARQGNVAGLQWLRGLDPPCPWDMETCSSAAKNGHLNVLEHARTLVPLCPWDVQTCALPQRMAIWMSCSGRGRRTHLVLGMHGHALSRIKWPSGYPAVSEGAGPFLSMGCRHMLFCRRE
jgi:hypothetical protein